MKQIILCLSCLVLLAVSCERKTDGDQSLTKKEKIKQEIDLINDSLNSSWNNMSASDDQKLKDIKRLLDEVSYTGKYNVLLYDSLVSLHKQLLAKRYDAATMSDSQKIDAYDQATDSLLKATFRLVNTTPEIENHPIAKTLIEDIMFADNNLVLYRARYDRWVKEYNSYVDRHSGKLEKLGMPYSTFKKKPMFSLQN
jgi:hypothetical protein